MNTKQLALAIVGLAALVGCSSSEAEMTKDELNALKNPSKAIPPEAARGMAKMGEMQQKQMDANAAAGVDSRGVPISKSGGQLPPPGTPANEGRGTR